MKDFRDLQVWHKAHTLALLVYRATSTFPKEDLELSAFTQEIKRMLTSLIRKLTAES
jgi:23S rRNA-intervening sequence protein